MNQNKCWIGDPSDHCVEAEIVGLLQDDRGDVAVVVRFESHGMYVKALHPSKVQMMDPRVSK